MSNHSRSHLYCSNCGVRLKGVQDLCPSCGKPLDETLLYENIEQVGAGGIGYSNITDHESFKAYKKFTKKILMISIPALTAFIIIVLIVMGTNPIIAVISGIVVFLFMLIASLITGRKKPDWEGTVVKKTYRRISRKDKSDTDIYTIVFKTDSGKKKKQEWQNYSGIYDYLAEGDRVRFIGSMGSPYAYEKYDKSKDIELPCVSCGSMMDPRYTYCTRCGSILLKGKTTE